MILDFSLGKYIGLTEHSGVELNFGLFNFLNADYRVIERRPMPGRNYKLHITSTDGVYDILQIL